MQALYLLGVGFISVKKKTLTGGERSTTSRRFLRNIIHKLAACGTCGLQNKAFSDLSMALSRAAISGHNNESHSCATGSLTARVCQIHRAFFTNEDVYAGDGRGMLAAI